MDYFHKHEAQGLAIVDREIGDHDFSPAKYEIVRRAIFATADFEYKEILRFSDSVLEAAATALASRCPIVTDVPTLSAGISDRVRATFANPVYCAAEALVRPQREKTPVAWGLETLARRFPNGIFAIGEDPTALQLLLELIATEGLRPAALVGVPSTFVDLESVQGKLRHLDVPSIWVEGRKGGPTVTAAIVNALIDLAWQAYGDKC